ncbi:MAG: WYL domain-containing protein [Oscillospiraceae bacterium]|nr:WYL domain-containing protein [Oscillospiraceae bacterium]
MEEKDKEKWDLSREEIEERIRKSNEEWRKKGATRGGRSSGQGVKLLYIRDYLYHHATKEHPQNANRIQEFLAQHDIEASVKTIYNDIVRLRDDFAVPVVYDASRWGYYITKPEFEPHELRLMVDSIQASKFITQREATTISQKITKLADVYTRPKLTDRHAVVAQRVRSKNEDVVREAGRIHQAIAENRKIGFRYFHYTPDRVNPKQYSKNGEKYVVSPYALLWDNGNYYLYAYITEKDEFRTFRVDRMEAITKPLPDKRDGEKAFKAETLTSQEYKVFQQYHGEKVKVRIRFINRLADAVIDQFGKETVMVPIDKDHFYALLPVELSPPFCAWVATFGRGAKILAPEAAITEMRKFIEKVSDMYKDDGEK